MASRIKGITVEIGGDTSGLEKSLSAVNNSIKKTQSQLRDVNNLRAGKVAERGEQFHKEDPEPASGCE